MRPNDLLAEEFLIVGGGFSLCDSVVKGILCDTLLYYKTRFPATKMSSLGLI